MRRQGEKAANAVECGVLRVSHIYATDEKSAAAMVACRWDLEHGDVVFVGEVPYEVVFSVPRAGQRVSVRRLRDVAPWKVEAERLHREGKTQAEIAEATGRAMSTVYAHLAEVGLR